MNVPRDVSYDDYLTASLTDPTEAAAHLEWVHVHTERDTYRLPT